MCPELEAFAPGISKLIKMYAKKYSFNDSDNEDLIQEGWTSFISLKFKLEKMQINDRKVYAGFFIRRAILDYSLANRRIVKMISSRDDRRAICGLCKDKNIHHNSSTETKINFAKKIGVSDESLDIAFAYFMQDISISVKDDETKFVDTTLESFGIFSNLENSNSGSASKLDFIYSEVDKLNNFEQIIINKRWLSEKKITLQEVSNDLSMSISGVAFVEKKAIEKIRVASGMYV